MTPDTWDTSTDPAKMLDWLCRQGAVSERKLRLFGCACVRRAWELFDEQSQASVEAVENRPEAIIEIEGEFLVDLRSHVGDGRASQARFITLPSWWFVHTSLSSGIEAYLKRLLGHILALVHEKANDTHAALRAVPGDEVRAARAAWQKAQAAVASEQVMQCKLLRDIFGNPFHPVPFDPTWRTPTVVSIAKQAYERRQLPAGHLDNRKLADLAELLGQGEPAHKALLEHLRGSAEKHVPGCWVIDGLLDKK